MTEKAALDLLYTLREMEIGEAARMLVKFMVDEREKDRREERIRRRKRNAVNHLPPDMTSEEREEVERLAEDEDAVGLERFARELAQERREKKREKAGAS